MRDYLITIFYSDEDGAYIATIPDLDGCAAHGDSPEEALAQLERAKDAWLRTAEANGVPIPPPRAVPPARR